MYTANLSIDTRSKKRGGLPELRRIRHPDHELVPEAPVVGGDFLIGGGGMLGEHWGRGGKVGW